MNAEDVRLWRELIRYLSAEELRMLREQDDGRRGWDFRL